MASILGPILFKRVPGLPYTGLQQGVGAPAIISANDRIFPFGFHVGNDLLQGYCASGNRAEYNDIVDSVNHRKYAPIQWRVLFLQLLR